jgi:hypothetical protein
MGLDLHVIPISAYIVGDYESAVGLWLRSVRMESVPAVRIGPGFVERITPPRTLWGRIQLHTGLWRVRQRIKRWQARRRRAVGLRYVEWLRGALKESLGVECAWSEEGDSVLTRQFGFGSLHALRTYALRVEFPDALKGVKAYKNDQGEDVDLVAAVYERASELKLESNRFRHLCDHSDVHGFYIPVAFDPPQHLDDPTREEVEIDCLKKTPVGSSVRILQELEELNEHLCIRSVWDTRERGLGPAETDDPDMTEVHFGWKLMEGFARTSVERNLPICFDG